jgi:hypothetical protein
VHKLIIEKGNVTEDKFEEKIREKTISSQAEMEKFTSVVLEKKRPLEKSKGKSNKKK